MLSASAQSGYAMKLWRRRSHNWKTSLRAGRQAMPANSPAEFAQHIADDAERWVKVIKTSGIRPE
jgi:tripartite-type tricarboxylate transporter receptor subunit TctC